MGWKISPNATGCRLRVTPKAILANHPTKKDVMQPHIIYYIYCVCVPSHKEMQRTYKKGINLITIETMNTETLNRQTREDIVKKCQALADAYGVLYGCSLIASDMAYSLETFEDIILTSGRLGKPFYVAMRKQGTESGTKEEAVQRCKMLGMPFLVLKIEEEGEGFFTLKMRK